MATGWLRVRGGLLEVERGRSVDADGSWTGAGDWGEYVYIGGETGWRLVSLIGDGMDTGMMGE